MGRGWGVCAENRNKRWQRNPNLFIHFSFFRKETIDLSQYDFPKTIWYMIESSQAAIKLVTLVPVM